MTEPNYAELFAAAQANRAKLDACPRHDFDVAGIDFSDPMQLFGVNVRCLRCDGSMPLTEANGYTRGYEAAGRNPDSIFPNFRGKSNDPVMCPACEGVQLGGKLVCSICRGTGKVARQTALRFIDEYL